LEITLPKPTIKTRHIDEQRTQQGVANGLHPVMARILASRPFDESYTPNDWLDLGLQALDPPNQLADCDVAVTRIIKAIQEEEVIGIETDHDCDGQTSHAVIHEALIRYFRYPKEKVKSYIGHRLNEGYGLSEKLVSRILEDDPRPSLIITADNGSSDESAIAKLKEQGIDVIVTDHHEIPVGGIPKSAVAVINPTRSDCAYPDPCIAGCMVAWLLMAAVRQGLLTQKILSEVPRLGGLLDYVAVGTVADCVSIARSKNNRIVVSKGMQLIEKVKRPCWQALLPYLTFPLHSEDLGFKIGPLLNSDGRLACAFGSVSFLLANDTFEARKWYEHLSEQNMARKSIQNRITEIGLEQATEQYLLGKRTLCINMEEGHAGVHGISASRIKDAFGRPTIIFCSKQGATDILTGSARSIPGLHLKNVLQKVKDLAPDTIERFGGHEGAAGLTIPKSQFALFAQNFEHVVQNDFEEKMFGPVVWSDGELDSHCLSQDFVEDLLDRLEPFGREFEPPQFEARAYVTSIKFMGAGKNHARLGLSIDDVWVNCVWFSCRKDEKSPAPVAVGDSVKVLYCPKVETFRGNKRLTCMINHLEVL